MNRFYRVISIIKKVIAANLLFAILIAALSVFLVVRALPENHMDMASAQTLLAARWWAREGFLKHRFLQLVAGYGKIVRYFEEPELSEHAKGDVAGRLTGHKIYYTHYPSLYIVPIALMMKLGINKLFILRLLSIIVSILGLIFLYVFIKLLSNKYIALVGALYFGISPIFIKWADSLEYIPQEDMWRFLILMLSIIVINHIRSAAALTKKVKYYLASIWAAYFLLSLTSFNSTFFIFTWLIGLSAIYIYNSGYKRKIRLFVILGIFWALAPIMGFGLQLIQNISYLGWHNTLLDIQSAFNAAGNRAGLGLLTRFDALIRPFFSMVGVYNFYALLVPFGITKFKLLIILLALVVVLAVIKLIKITGYKIPSLSILALLAIAPLSQTIIMPFTGFRDNLGRLYAPFVGIIIGIIVYILFLLYKNKIEISKLFNKIILFFLSVAVLSLFIIQLILNNSPRFWPPYTFLSKNDIAFTEEMKNIAPGGKAVFMINNSDTKIPEEELKKRFAVYDPIHYQKDYLDWEYYFDMPLLNFINTSYLVRDLLFLEKQAEFPFTAIITSDSPNLINELRGKLQLKQLLLSPVKTLENRYFFLVGK